MSEREQPGKRSYQQYCGLAKALDLVGERWTLLVIRELLLGPRRWGQLLDKLPGLTTNLLAKRLADLQAAGLIVRVPAPPGDPEPGRKGWYALSESGRALEPAAPVDPDVSRTVHDDIGDLLLPQDRLERAGPGELMPEGAHQVEHRVVAQHQALGAQSRGHPRRSRLRLLQDKSRPDPVGQGRRHAALPRASTIAGSTSAQARP